MKNILLRPQILGCEGGREVLSNLDQKEINSISGNTEDLLAQTVVEEEVD